MKNWIFNYCYANVHAWSQINVEYVMVSGNPAGTVVVSNKAYNAFSKEEYEIVSSFLFVPYQNHYLKITIMHQSVEQIQQAEFKHAH